MPIQRLDEKPERSATLQDITCDSDGKIEMCIRDRGMAYENGNGVEENPQKAVEYMMKAAEQDYGYAACG